MAEGVLAAGSREADDVAVRTEAVPRVRRRPPLPLLLVLSACGVVLVSIAYAAGRDGRGWAEAAYWCGQLAIFAPLAIWVLTPDAPHKGVAIVAQATFQSLVKWMYSPLMFKFPDELQHRRTAEDILQHHGLFHPSNALPISPRFPGLEEISTALVSLTHLDLFTAGILVASIAHVALAAGIFVLLRGVLDDERIAAIGAMIFAVNPHQPFFNGMFVYEAPAFVFMVVALHAATRPAFRPRVELPLVLICLMAVAVTHHVTAAVTVLALLALGVVLSLRGGLRGLGARVLGLGGVGAAFVALWVVFAAPQTYNYLSGPVSSVLSGFLREGSTKGKDAVGAGVSPILTGVTGLGTLVMCCLVAGGTLVIWRRASSPLTRAFAVLGLGFFGVLGIRFVASDGAELAGRLLTYEYIFAVVPAATALFVLRGRWRRAGPVLAVLAAVAVLAGNMTSGWPAPYELVPGTFKVDAFESGVTPAGVQAAEWIGTHLPPRATVACDWSTCSLVGGYGTQRALADRPELFYAPTMDDATRRMITAAGVQYVAIDRRITTQRPETGHYFNSETPDQKALVPFPPGPLAKFDGAAGVDRIFDNGAIVVYDVRRAGAV